MAAGDVPLSNLNTDLSKDAQDLLRVTSADLDVLIKHYSITKAILKDIVNSVREWLKKHPHLPQDQIHDRQILGHLILQGFSVEQTKRNIEGFYTARRRLPEFMQGRDPGDKDWLWNLQQGFWVVLPKKTADNYRTTIFRFHDDIGGQVSQIMKVACLLCEYRTWNDLALGDCWILDFKHVSLQHALQMTPVMVAKILFFLTTCFATKLKSVHLINMPSFAVSVLNLFKKGIKTKLVNRIQICQPEDLLNIFTEDVLPVEYGGIEKSCQKITDEWVQMFQSEPWKNYLQEQDSVLTDEAKRLTPSAADQLFGVSGSFRKLQLD